jgi:Protein of unknown function (DUF3179)
VLLGLLVAACGCGAADESASGADPLAGAPPVELTHGWRTDFSRHTVAFDEIGSGGPPKDGIPAIDEPRFVPVSAVRFLEGREPILALELNRDARAYPIQILIWHEIVNDRVGGVPVAVTFCPLCNTAIVFDRRLDGRTLEFGTTGKLRNSDLVMYDRQTESWWQQFGGEGIVGRYAGRRLARLPARIVSWDAFRREHPTGRVLTRDTGHAREYGRNPYAGYDDAAAPPFFPAANADDARLLPKERVVFFRAGAWHVAVPFSVLARRRRVEVDGYVVRWRPGVASPLDDASVAAGRDVGSVEVRRGGRLVPFEEPFWFVVAAFAPEAGSSADHRLGSRQTSGQFTTVDVCFRVTSPAPIASFSSAYERSTRRSAVSFQVAWTTRQSGG